jgi:xylan 1,4-beta-xylosidase
LPIDKGEARLRHYRIDEDHSNSFSLWKKLGEPQQPTAEQYNKLEQAGKLADFEGPDHIAAENGRATIRFALPRQAVSLVVLTF